MTVVPAMEMLFVYTCLNHAAREHTSSSSSQCFSYFCSFAKYPPWVSFWCMIIHSCGNCEHWKSKHVPIHASTFKEMFVTHPKLVHHFLWNDAQIYSVVWSVTLFNSLNANHYTSFEIDKQYSVRYQSIQQCKHHIHASIHYINLTFSSILWFE
jgi:hypothetical protein